MEMIDMIYKDDFNVITKNLPHEIKGSVNKNRDGSYTVFINARLSYEQQREVFEHEMSHVIREDFEKYHVDTIEREGHGKTTVR